MATTSYISERGSLAPRLARGADPSDDENALPRAKVYTRRHGHTKCHTRAPPTRVAELNEGQHGREPTLKEKQKHGGAADDRATMEWSHWTEHGDEAAKRPPAPTMSPPNAHQPDRTHHRPKLTEGGTTMGVTAPRASLPPNPKGFVFSPRHTSRGTRRRGKGITLTAPTSRRRRPQASPSSWPAEPAMDFSGLHVFPTPSTDAAPATWASRRPDLTGAERVGDGGVRSGTGAPAATAPHSHHPPPPCHPRGQGGRPALATAAG
nr:uncharacterized protein LOC109769822 [Aegilops tauschii subsp. strangulata]